MRLRIYNSVTSIPKKRRYLFCVSEEQMPNLSSFFVEVFFALMTIVLMALTSVEAEVGWANSSHSAMWADLEPDFRAGE